MKTLLTVTTSAIVFVGLIGGHAEQNKGATEGGYKFTDAEVAALEADVKQMLVEERAATLEPSKEAVVQSGDWIVGRSANGGVIMGSELDADGNAMFLCNEGVMWFGVHVPSSPVADGAEGFYGFEQPLHDMNDLGARIAVTGMDGHTMEEAPMYLLGLDGGALMATADPRIVGALLQDVARNPEIVPMIFYFKGMEDEKQLLALSAKGGAAVGEQFTEWCAQ